MVYESIVVCGHYMRKERCYMKKIWGIAVAIAIFLAGCQNSAKEIDAAALAGSLVNEITYEDKLESVDADTISMYIEVPENTEAIMYMGSGSTAEEVAVFTSKDAETAGETLKKVQEHLDDQTASFKAYKAEEAKRVEDAVLKQEGKYVILCVSGDTDKANEIIEKAFK